MNVLNIAMRPHYMIKNPSLFIDGERVYTKKSKNGEYTCRFETEKDSVELSVYKFLEINGKFWFLYSILFFFISLLGIFDAHYDNKCYCLKYKTVLTLNEETNVKLVFNQFKESGAAINCTADCPAEETENEYYTDKQAKKRLKIMRIVKLLCWLAAIAIAVVVILYKVIGF